MPCTGGDSHPDTLERGRFSWPRGEPACAPLRGEELVALLAGLEVRAKANWFRR